MTDKSEINTEPLPINVWPVSQTTSQYQRAGRYLPECAKHPGKMVPSLARQIVDEFSKPGDLVVDPMAGIGTTVVEGALIDRHCVGVELEESWTDLAKRNIDHMIEGSKRELAFVTQGDARDLSTALGSLHGSVDLIATSPPYSCEVGTVDSDRATGHLSRAHSSANYSTDRSNLGHARGARYQTEMAGVYRSCFDALRPGGLMVTVTKNMHQRERLLDVARATVDAAGSVGFQTMEHIIALLCAVRSDGLVARPSFWQQRSVRNARRKGLPQYLIAHEDVLVFRKPDNQPGNAPPISLERNHRGVISTREGLSNVA